MLLVDDTMVSVNDDVVERVIKQPGCRSSSRMCHTNIHAMFVYVHQLIQLLFACHGSSETPIEIESRF